MRPKPADRRRPHIDQVRRDVVANVVILLEEIRLPIPPVDGRVNVAVEERMQMRPEPADRRRPYIDQVGRDVVANVVVPLEEIDLPIPPIDDCVNVAVEERMQMRPNRLIGAGPTSTPSVSRMARLASTSVAVLYRT